MFSIHQIFKDQGKHDALICEYCTVDLKRSFWVRERMRNIEGFHFSKKRKAYEDEQGERQESSAKRSVELEAIEEVQQQLKKKEAPIQNKPTFSHDDKIKKVFQCPVCELKLATRFSLANHNNSVHLKITRFNCSMCPKKFYYKNHLIMHLNKHQ